MPSNPERPGFSAGNSRTRDVTTTGQPCCNAKGVVRNDRRRRPNPLGNGHPYYLFYLSDVKRLARIQGFQRGFHVLKVSGDPRQVRARQRLAETGARRYSEEMGGPPHQTHRLCRSVPRGEAQAALSPGNQPDSPSARKAPQKDWSCQLEFRGRYGTMRGPWKMHLPNAAGQTRVSSGGSGRLRRG